MKSRLIASLAVGAAIALGTTGCAMISPQATTIHYSPADGVSVSAPGSPLQVRNALIVADEAGENGNFVAAIVNDTDDAQTLSLEFGEGSGAIQKSVRVPARSVVSLGSDDTEPLLVKGIDTLPGSDLPVFFQSGDADTVRADIPVLDGSLSYLESLAP
ncbi:DNA modification methylase [Microbacterium ulmi]|uniref:DNA modification methylase n=1 Tax=Microbacterium ulmi TaxID=179095 RepID=A0A7Y2Q0K1_9MICO|nr:DNA modification methylase [Microbacterium ulmi]NII68513.1 hypothetical protein [Microbacterium ulmi]NNH02965.1 DNA modification methylase [Microbacterium ulmi]